MLSNAEVVDLNAISQVLYSLILMLELFIDALEIPNALAALHVDQSSL